MANVAQGAATLAVFLCAHEGKLKGLAGASAASALMGITEPAIFGVNLRLRGLQLAAKGVDQLLYVAGVRLGRQQGIVGERGILFERTLLAGERVDLALAL